MAKFCPLFSSSTGNSIYIGGGDDSILIDVGMTARQIEQSLFGIGVDADSIRNIFITHEHNDHVKGLKVFTKKHKARVFMTAGTYEALAKTDALDNVSECKIITDDGADVGCMLIKPFAISHDCIEPCGYTIELANGRKLAVATDLGIMTDTVFDALKGSDLVMLESNHDVNMLQCGGYPYMLKRRILGVKGHLSNDACAETLARLIKTVYKRKKRNEKTQKRIYETDTEFDKTARRALLSEIAHVFGISEGEAEKMINETMKE
jgi:phosphoribosyl 1,2-cyclic phosphodiesterase